MLERLRRSSGQWQKTQKKESGETSTPEHGMVSETGAHRKGKGKDRTPTTRAGRDCALKTATSEFVDVRGLRYHVQRWGRPQAPKLFLLHGWMDVAASFQFLVDALIHDWCVLSPDWRGFGESGWSTGSYLFADYLADLEALLDWFAPGEPIDLAGHSLGGNVACIYAGVRPERVRAVVSLEGFGIHRAQSVEAPERYARWLDEQAQPPRLAAYPSLERVASRLRKNNPRLTAEQAVFLARHWARGDPNGGFVLKADPRHKMKSPVLYRIEEAMACWRRVRAPVLWIEGAVSPIRSWLGEDESGFAARMRAFGNLRHELVPGAGHMLHHDAPAPVAALIEEFLWRPAAPGETGNQGQ
jgi:pimeloyl-ACP methyl ester carboxylesterase